MNLFRIFPRKPSLADSARHMGKLGAQVRQERARAARKAFHRDMRARLGLDPVKAFEG